MNRRPALRVMALMWAVLQLALPAAFAVADGQLERQGAGASASHVESTSTSACRPVHSAECALCQLLTRPLSASARVELPVIAAALVVTAPDERAGHSASAHAWLPGARAPPVA